ncbi:SDR family oxidoreductase [Agathobaculum butyriciproducens]|nr:SDR family oxidoreductase [Agathobaculum butyriciproducens]
MVNMNGPVKMASYDMAGKTAVVTGGTKGIGKAIALAFGQCGANVVVAGRHEDECTAVAEAITSAGGHGKGIRTDVRNIDEIDALIAGAAENFGGVDILINCAGVAITKKILDLDVEDYDMIMETNLRSVLFASKAAAAVMKASEKGGKIINIASVGGLKGTSALSLYGASKAGVINLTKTMALEWSRYGIQTNAVCPGYVVTEINKAEFENEKFKEHVLKTIPQRRLGTVDEVAALVLFLASDMSGMINGEAIVADMGAICG